MFAGAGQGQSKQARGQQGTVRPSIRLNSDFLEDPREWNWPILAFSLDAATEREHSTKEQSLLPNLRFRSVTAEATIKWPLTVRWCCRKAEADFSPSAINNTKRREKHDDAFVSQSRVFYATNRIASRRIRTYSIVSAHAQEHTATTPEAICSFFLLYSYSRGMKLQEDRFGEPCWSPTLPKQDFIRHWAESTGPVVDMRYAPTFQNSSELDPPEHASTRLSRLCELKRAGNRFDG